MIKPLLAACLVLLAWVQPGVCADYAVTPETAGKAAALAQGLRPGDRLTFKAGVYATPIKLPRMTGAPNNPIVLTAESGAVFECWKDKSTKQYDPGSCLLVQGSKYLRIEHFNLSGAARGLTLGSCEFVTVHGNSMHDISNYGIMCWCSNNVEISENTIQKSSIEHGIYVSGKGHDIKLIRNAVSLTHINGIHINGAFTGIEVRNNTLDSTGAYPTREGGAGLTLVGGVTAPKVENNVFKNIYGQGITVEAPDAVIQGNTFESYSWSGVLILDRARNVTLKNNQFQDGKVIPINISESALDSLNCIGNRYSSSVKAVCLTLSKKTFTLSAWQALGKDRP